MIEGSKRIFSFTEVNAQDRHHKVPLPSTTPETFCILIPSAVSSMEAIYVEAMTPPRSINPACTALVFTTSYQRILTNSINLQIRSASVNVRQCECTPVHSCEIKVDF